MWTSPAVSGVSRALAIRPAARSVGIVSRARLLATSNRHDRALLAPDRRFGRPSVHITCGLVSIAARIRSSAHQLR